MRQIDKVKATYCCVKCRKDGCKMQQTKSYCKECIFYADGYSDAIDYACSMLLEIADSPALVERLKNKLQEEI